MIYTMVYRIALYLIELLLWVHDIETLFDELPIPSNPLNPLLTSLTQKREHIYECMKPTLLRPNPHPSIFPSSLP